MVSARIPAHFTPTASAVIYVGDRLDFLGTLPDIALYPTLAALGLWPRNHMVWQFERSPFERGVCYRAKAA